MTPMKQNNQPQGCQPMTYVGDPTRVGAKGVNGRGTQPLKPLLVGRSQTDARDLSTEAKP